MVKDDKSMPSSPKVNPAPIESKPAELVEISKSLTALEIDEALDKIFVKISSKDETKQGVTELYEFQRVYTDQQSKIDQRLADFGVNFRIYIRRSLEKLAEEKGHASKPLTDSHSNIDYRDRLAKLQQRYKSQSDDMPVVPADAQSNHADVLQLPNDAPVPTEQISSVMALKERLARMKSSMASLNES